MRELTIQIKNNEDANLLLQLVSRLGLKVTKDTAMEKEKERIKYYQEIIMKGGGDMSEKELNEMLESIKEGRKGRDLPFDKI